MPRRSTEPRYYKSKGGYYAVFHGRRVLLAAGPKNDREVKARAWEKYRQEAAAAATFTAGDDMTVGQVLNAWYDRQTREVKPNTLQNHRCVLEPFIAQLGKKRVRDLRPRHVEEFLHAMRKGRVTGLRKNPLGWGDSTVAKCITTLRTAFRWAVNEELIARSPMGVKGAANIKAPVVCYEDHPAVTEQEHRAFLELARRRGHKHFVYLLELWWNTGCRPAEMSLARADEWEDEHQRFHIRAADPRNVGRFKLARLKKDRYVYVTDELVPLVRKLVAEAGPDGLLLHNEQGRPYTRKAVARRMALMAEVANRRAAARGQAPAVRKGVTAYAYRRGFVTRWLTDNRNLTKLCDLLNTSETQVRRHYLKLFAQPKSLLDELRAFTQSRQSEVAGSGDLGNPVLKMNVG